MKERKRLGVVDFAYNHQENLTENERSLRRPKLIILNAILTISLIVILIKGLIPAPVLFLLASMLALLINYPRLNDQQKVLRGHGMNIFLVSSMIFVAGIFSGFLQVQK
jgi:CitMHS family citrate-Mg2+:H+ or citrate-Ca2+:H+ symporter